MFTKDEILNMVFFDLETAPQFSNLNDLIAADPRRAALWEKRCVYLRSRYPENSEKSDFQLYVEKAALHPEFLRVVCGVFIRLQEVESPIDGTSFQFKTHRVGSFDEVETIRQIRAVFASKDPSGSRKYVGHNIRRFDVPVICKQILIHGMSLPQRLMLHNLKPWEQPFIDTSELWSFGAWQEGFISLDLLSASLDLPSPKANMSGDEVGPKFWEGLGDAAVMDEILDYCELDVKTVANVILKLSSFPIVEEE